MKLVENPEPKEEFKPFDITLRIERNEEARLLWHVFNRIGLRRAIFSDNYGTIYKQEIAEHFYCTSEILGFVESKIVGGV